VDEDEDGKEEEERRQVDEFSVMRKARVAGASPPAAGQCDERDREGEVEEDRMGRDPVGSSSGSKFARSVDVEGRGRRDQVEQGTAVFLVAMDEEGVVGRRSSSREEPRSLMGVDDNKGREEPAPSREGRTTGVEEEGNSIEIGKKTEVGVEVLSERLVGTAVAVVVLEVLSSIRTPPGDRRRCSFGTEAVVVPAEVEARARTPDGDGTGLGGRQCSW
jgi:hypothetical protein